MTKRLGKKRRIAGKERQLLRTQLAGLYQQGASIRAQLRRLAGRTALCTACWLSRA